MTDWKGIVKKEGSSLKGQVKGFIGRGDTPSAYSASSHSAAPLSTLRDPYSFGPPPKRTGSSGHVPGAGVQASGSAAHQSPAGRAYGAPQYQQQQIEEPPVESRPYRVDTSGLSTSHLPPPPARRGSPDNPDHAPPPYSPVRPSGPPSLPPRLPPRGGNASAPQAQSPTSTGGAQSGGYLNQGAIDRLGAAGISVPGLGIGGKASSTPPPPGRSSSTASNGQINELQSRFSHLNSTTPSQQGSTATATQGTTWAEKQAALRTASSFKKDPSSVSLADARAAAGTAHNFHQRHGDQVASGLNTANGLSQRFGVGEQNGQASSSSPMGQIAGVIGKKKPAPPPPKKKPLLSGAGSGGGAPPPVPMGTKPKFN
ncbi:hypothetical protein GGR54DRAFT_635264 [Hypoxylon sp. NC1633]|nr:hypothetical protein GGR54DRAFT_635264 [Hypoxylon sp. NC1633]